MTLEPRLDIIGAALADPSRARILCELMDGRAFTNKELACAARITAQTASVHLRQLSAAGLTTSLRSGRHVYHRIARAEVATVLESLASLSPTDHLRRNSQNSRDTCLARSCYNHIAGRLGVLMTRCLAASDVLLIASETVAPGPRYMAFLKEAGIDVPPVAGGKPLVKLCLDWTERRHHISGPFATAILDRAVTSNWLQRRTGSRSLMITEDGFQALDRFFALGRDEVAQDGDASELGG
ncbi:ArsR/SmtB family transcription factor [Roseovarius sp. S4756]|uniref:ArsR/SmtB family transcription factor n=1 Tax=Roseovarius maritimus TaxID=3342637 RepID=UPI003729E9BF